MTLSERGNDIVSYKSKKNATPDWRAHSSGSETKWRNGAVAEARKAGYAGVLRKPIHRGCRPEHNIQGQF